MFFSDKVLRTACHNIVKKNISVGRSCLFLSIVMFISPQNSPAALSKSDPPPPALSENNHAMDPPPGIQRVNLSFLKAPPRVLKFLYKVEVPKNFVGTQTSNCTAKKIQIMYSQKSNCEELFPISIFIRL